MPAAAKPERPATPRKAARALGRAFADFGKLGPAEKTLLDCSRRGEFAWIGTERPETETDDNRVRAAFLRFLALGGDDGHPVHEHGVQLAGAWIVGSLDLEGAKVPAPLYLWRCALTGIEAVGAALAHLALDGSRLTKALTGDRLTCEGGVFLRAGFHVTGAVRLNGARIEGIFDCDGGRFEGKDDVLNADGAQIAGAVFMREGFHATGEVRLVGAKIGGDLSCVGAHFEKPEGDAFSLDGAEIGGSVFLREGFKASGTVRFPGARIGNSLECHSAYFEGAENAVSFENARVDGMFTFRKIAQVKGKLRLTSMHVASLCDDQASWQLAQGQLELDDFVYGRLVGTAPTDAEARIAWLDSQKSDDLGESFRPQPWEQLISVLRSMGHPEAARTIAIAKQDRLRTANKIVRGGRTLHRLYGLLVGYGYRPQRLLVTTASIWLLCAAAYWGATNPQWFGSGTHLLAPPPPETGHAARPPDYPNFVPLIYSADVLLPVIDLGYKKEWQPVVADAAGNSLPWGQALRFLYWFEIAFGWVAGLLLVGILGNLIKKD